MYSSETGSSIAFSFNLKTPGLTIYKLQGYIYVRGESQENMIKRQSIPRDQLCSAVEEYDVI
jgi:hypothetical protein